MMEFLCSINPLWSRTSNACCNFEHNKMYIIYESPYTQKVIQKSCIKIVYISYFAITHIDNIID